MSATASAELNSPPATTEAPHCPACAGRPSTPLILAQARYSRCLNCGCCYLGRADARWERLDPSQLLEQEAREHRSAVQLLSLITSCRASGTFLDAGASSGVLTLLARRVGYRVEAIEAAPERRAFALQRGVDTTAETLLTPRLHPGAFEIVALHGYLERVTDPASVLVRARQLLDPLGLIFVSVRSGGVPSTAPDSLEEFCPRPGEHSTLPAGALGAVFAAAQVRLVDLYSPDGHQLLAIGEAS